MLILTRRIGESVYIGDEIRLTVLGVRGTQVRIGINAPKDIPVHREEIYYRIKQEQASGNYGDGQPNYRENNPQQGYANQEEYDSQDEYDGQEEDEHDPHNV